MIKSKLFERERTLPNTNKESPINLSTELKEMTKLHM
jgi:hypothetical protein